MEDRRDGQTYCDRRHGPLTPGSIVQSEHFGLDGEFSWACESCLASEGYRHPPDGWSGEPAQWPSMTATPTRVSVRLAEPADDAQLADLLSRNRDYFRSGEPKRRDAYYTLDAQRRIIEQAVEPRRAGRALMFVIEEDGELAGRINLNSLIRGAFQSASVGYLVDQHMTGRGIATAALRLVIDIAFGELNLHRLQAETLTDNPASQRVLRRCGFVHAGRAPEYLKIDGRWQTNDLLQLINPDYCSE